MRKLLLLVMLLLGGMTSYGQVATKAQWGVARSTDSLNETRDGFLLGPGAGKALKLLIDANTAAINGKQATLVSGSNLKTVGGQSLLGPGDIPLPSGGSATPLSNNLTTTTTGTALDAAQGKIVADSLKAQRDRIAANTANFTNYAPKAGVSNEFTVDGNLRLPSVNGRWMGFYGLSPGQTVRLQMGDPTGGLDVSSGAGMTVKAYHGVIVQNQDGGSGPALRVNGLSSQRSIFEFYDAASNLRALLSQAGQLLVSGGIKFGDGTTLTTAPTGGGSGGVPSLTDPAGFASATADQVEYDNNKWKRFPGTVQTDPIEQNNRYTATQYNGSGSFHYERQFDGPVYFRWWRNASADNHNRLRAMINSGYTDMKVDSGKYYFDSYAWSPGNFHIVGDLGDPKKVQFISRGANALDNAPNTRIFRGWFFFDGVTPGQSFDNITIEGITFINQCTATISNTPTNATGSYGPITYDGANQRNILINRCEFYNRTKTAPTNFAYFKVGANKLQDNIRITNSRTDNPDSTRARMFVEIINQEHPGSDKTVGKGIRIDNNFIRGVYYGTSVAGNYEGTVVELNRYGFCRDYGSEFAGSNVNATLRGNSFFGTMNVLWVSNYHGETGASGGDYAIPDSTGQRFTDNYTLGKVNGGYVEIYGGGKMDFSRNNISIDGGVYLQRMADKGGVTGGVFASNTIVSTMTNANWLQRTTNLLYLNGVKDLTVRDNTIRRSKTVDGALIQSNDNGVSSVSNLYYNNVLEATKNGTGSAYFGNAGTSGVRVGNINMAGTSVN